ncbi:MAG: YqeG family HAD IIIA-type phosphatase [Acholeplasmataceae bacterium]|jgi:HAD superfamily phosphatase (TIGR01668 family)|nr:YqeG family HAD IIIA-type phosphatase [Acholeplasmataceae bacterium]
MALYQKCIPSSYATSIFEIDYDKMKKQGIKSLFFDLDNTIIAYDESQLSDKHLAFFKALLKDFKIVVISNSGYKRVSEALIKLDVPYVHHSLKPTTRGLKKALKLAGTTKEETVLIGDQLMTDVLGASRFNIESILVRAVKRKSDRWMTRLNRRIEKSVLRKIKKVEPNLYQERLKAYVDGQ